MWSERRPPCVLAFLFASAALAACSSEDDGARGGGSGDASSATDASSDAAASDGGDVTRSDAPGVDGQEPESGGIDGDGGIDPGLMDRSQCSGEPDAIGVTHRSVTVAGKTLSYVGYAPPSYDNGKPTPLVISLHGAGDTADNYFSMIWRGNADMRGLLVVSPEGSATAGRGFTYTGDDANMIGNHVIEHFARCYTVDPRRRIIHGFSAGGNIAYLVGLLDATTYAGISISSADLGTAEYYAGRGLLPAPWTVPVSHTHGLEDSNFPIATARDGRDRLIAAGHEVFWHEFAGGHRTNAAYALQMYDDLASSVAP